MNKYLYFLPGSQAGSRFIRIIKNSLLTFILLSLPLFVTLAEEGNQQATDKRIAGRIVDNQGEPLIGATVIEKGNPSKGSISDLDGKFSLEVSSNAIIEVSYIGYITQEIATEGQNEFNIILLEEIQSLDEVVVVGYGTMKKVNLTGSVASVNYSEQINGTPVLNTAASLSGLVAGMNVMQGSGKPGEESVAIRIRGLGTFNSSGGSNSPLILVDGMEWSMSNVNPNDIETISVLKDAASTAIYGTRGANGVILITTKKGEGKPQINYTFSGIWQNPYTNNLKFLSDYATYMELVNEATDNVSATNIFSPGSIESWKLANLDPNGSLLGNGVPNYIAFPNTDWFNEIFQPGFSQQHNISFSKSSDSSSLLVSLGYMNNEGVMNRYNIDSGMRRIDFRTNAESKVYDWFTIGTRISGQRQDNGMANVTQGFNRLYMTTPGVYPGTPNAWGVPALAGEESSNANNILADQAGGTGHDLIYRLNTSAYMKFEPFKQFFIEGTVRFAPVFTDRLSYSRQNGRWDYVNDERYSESVLANATITSLSGLSHNLDTELLLRYNTDFDNHKHEIGGIAGFSSNKYTIKNFQTQKRGATDWSLTDLSAYEEIVSVSSSAPRESALLSYFGRVNYAYLSRYLFEGNIRFDGSSKFGSSTRWGMFPSASAAWRVSEEEFMQDVIPALSNLKLRASYGKTGNNSVGYYDWQALYSIKNATVDGTPSKGFAMTSLSNEYLGWETTHTLDIGLDYGFFNNRLFGEVDLYNRRTTDILFTPSLYLTTGNMTAPPANMGELNNNGVEFSINWKDRIGKDFSYSIGANFSYSTNQVTKFKGAYETYWNYDENGIRTEYVTNYSAVAQEQSAFGTGGHIVEGKQLGETFIYKVYRGTGTGYSGGDVDVNAGPKNGIIRTEHDMDWVKAMIDNGYSFGGKKTISRDQLWYGDMLYMDENEDGNYGDTNDRVFSGHTSIPKYNVGLNLSATYKGFDISMQWAGAFGFHLLWNTAYYNTSVVSHGYGIIEHIANDHYFYDPDNPDDPRTNFNATYPRLTYGDAFNNNFRSDFYEYKGDYIKLKNAQLGYQIPTRISRQFHVQKLRTYVSMQNILTLTKFPGLDPEIGTSIGYPLMRQVSVGAQITF